MHIDGRGRECRTLQNLLKIISSQLAELSWPVWIPYLTNWITKNSKIFKQKFVHQVDWFILTPSTGPQAGFSANFREYSSLLRQFGSPGSRLLRVICAAVLHPPLDSLAIPINCCFVFTKIDLVSKLNCLLVKRPYTLKYWQSLSQIWSQDALVQFCINTDAGNWIKGIGHYYNIWYHSKRRGLIRNEWDLN